MARDNSVTHPMDKPNIAAMSNPVALSIPGIGIICYMELRALPENVFGFVAQKADRLEMEIQRKSDQLNRIRDFLHN